MTRKVNKISKVLISLNIIVLLIIIVFYCVRFVKYYRLENRKSINISLARLVKSKHSDNLYYDEDSGVYTFKGNANNNYVIYEDTIYRIISIDGSNRVKLINEYNDRSMKPDFMSGYTSSSVVKWLNSNIEDSIYEKTNFCNDIINDLNKITCKNIFSDYKFSLLSMYDYANAGGKDSYLFKGEELYFGSLDNNNNEYYVDSEGNYKLNLNNSEITIRAVLTLNNKVKVLSGSGSKTNPYLIGVSK